MRFRIQGIDKKSGIDIKPYVLDADSKEDAICKVNSKGIYLSSIDELNDDQEPEAISDTNAEETVTEYEDVRTSTNMKFFGSIAFLAGVGCCLYFCFAYDTSVSAGYGQDKVRNIGLMQNQLIGAIAGMGVAFAGIICFVAGIIVNGLENIQQNSSSQSAK